MATQRPDDVDHYPEPSDEDLQRVRDLLRRIGGERVDWGAAHTFEVLAGEHRLKMDRLASERLTHATWWLAGVTAVLTLATIVLVVATIVN